MAQLKYTRTGDLQSAVKQLLANLFSSGASGTGADAIGYTPAVGGGPFQGSTVADALDQFNAGTTGPINLPIKGVTTNSNAAAGIVGEIISSSVAAGTVSLTSATVANITSISLTAGDWDVNCYGYFTPAATTSVTQWVIGISTTNGTTLPATGQRFIMVLGATVPGGTLSEFPTGTIRLSLASTTTVFLNARSNFTVSTMTAGGQIVGRRAR